MRKLTVGLGDFHTSLHNLLHFHLHQQRVPPESIFATIKEPTLTHHYCPGSIVYVRAEHSMGSNKCIYNDMYPSL